jgi:lauroyl/myristoyl acyltransferase
MSILQKATNYISTEIKYWAFRSVSFLTGVVPLRVTYGLSVLAGDLVYLTWKRHSANAVSNMRRVMGDAADPRTVKLAARDSFRNSRAE